MRDRKEIEELMKAANEVNDPAVKKMAMDMFTIELLLDIRELLITAAHPMMVLSLPQQVPVVSEGIGTAPGEVPPATPVEQPMTPNQRLARQWSKEHIEYFITQLQANGILPRGTFEIRWVEIKDGEKDG